jgi:Secretion system C-terminal sorting domain
MKRISIFCLLISSCASSRLDAQALASPILICTASARAQSSQGSLDWSIGEPITAIYAHVNATLSQGFHQVFLAVTTDVIEAPDSWTSPVHVYPNPTTGWVQIETEAAIRTRIFDILGREIMSDQSLQINPALSLSGFSTGIYFLEINTEKSQRPFVFRLEVIR